MKYTLIVQNKQGATKTYVGNTKVECMNQMRQEFERGGLEWRWINNHEHT